MSSVGCIFLARLNALCCCSCGRQFFKYVCPRCNIPYCSLTCYKVRRRLLSILAHVRLSLLVRSSTGATALSPSFG